MLHECALYYKCVGKHPIYSKLINPGKFGSPYLSRQLVPCDLCNPNDTAVYKVDEKWFIRGMWVQAVEKAGLSIFTSEIALMLFSSLRANNDPHYLWMENWLRLVLLFITRRNCVLGCTSIIPKFALYDFRNTTQILIQYYAKYFFYE